MDGSVGNVLALTPGNVVFLVTVTLLFQAFFAGYETGLLSLSVILVEERAAEGRRSAKLLRRMLKRPDRLLTMCLIGTNLAVVFGTLVMVFSIGRLWTMVVYTPLVLVLGELVPKSLFRHYATTLVLGLVYIARAFYIVMSPVVYAIGGLTRLANKALGRHGEVYSPFLTRDDVRRLIVQGEASGTIETEERKLIHCVMALSATVAKEVMIPRINVAAIDVTATQRELFDLFETSGHTRLPVYRETLDHIVGVVNMYDLLKQERIDPDLPIEGLVQDIIVVPDTKNVGELLYEMRTQRNHIALILDEYGGTAGAVTIEDLVEEVFGEIQDEYDSEETPIMHLGGNAYQVLASVDVDDLAEELHIELPEGEFETVGGFVMDLSGKIPEPGEVCSYGDVTITVLKADEQGIGKVRIDVKDREHHDEE
jgi:putative hemolysin